jgi:hypothetical protein
VSFLSRWRRAVAGRPAVLSRESRDAVLITGWRWSALSELREMVIRP